MAQLRAEFHVSSTRPRLYHVREQGGERREVGILAEVAQGLVSSAHGDLRTSLVFIRSALDCASILVAADLRDAPAGRPPRYALVQIPMPLHTMPTHRILHG